MRISDWSSDVCSSDLAIRPGMGDGSRWKSVIQGVVRIKGSCQLARRIECVFFPFPPAIGCCLSRWTAEENGEKDRYRSFRSTLPESASELIADRLHDVCKQRPSDCSDLEYRRYVGDEIQVDHFFTIRMGRV